MILNMGPQHPSTHGVLRLVLEVEGENVVRMMPDIGYLHTGIEKTYEAKFYQQCIVLADRMDYLAPFTNELGFVLAVERLLGIDVPPHQRAIVRAGGNTRAEGPCARDRSSRSIRAQARIGEARGGHQARAGSRSQPARYLGI